MQWNLFMMCTWGFVKKIGNLSRWYTKHCRHRHTNLNHQNLGCRLPYFIVEGGCRSRKWEQEVPCKCHLSLPCNLYNQYASFCQLVKLVFIILCTCKKLFFVAMTWWYCASIRKNNYIADSYYKQDATSSHFWFSFLIVKECRDTFQLMKFQVFWRYGNVLIDKWWSLDCNLLLLCEEMVWVALELSGYKLVWSTDGSVLPAVNWKWSSSLNTYTIYTMALSKIGNRRFSYSDRHEIAYSFGSTFRTVTKWSRMMYWGKHTNPCV